MNDQGSLEAVEIVKDIPIYDVEEKPAKDYVRRLIAEIVKCNDYKMAVATCELTRAAWLSYYAEGIVDSTFGSYLEDTMLKSLNAVRRVKPADKLEEKKLSLFALNIESRLRQLTAFQRGGSRAVVASLLNPDESKRSF